MCVVTIRVGGASPYPTHPDLSPVVAPPRSPPEHTNHVWELASRNDQNLDLDASRIAYRHSSAVAVEPPFVTLHHAADGPFEPSSE